jgi:hypothetical protein
MEMFDSPPALSNPEAPPKSKVKMDWVPSYTATPLSKTANSVEDSTEEWRVRADSVLNSPSKSSSYADRARSWSVETMSRVSSPLFARNANAGTFPQPANPCSPHKRKVSRLGGLTTDVPGELMLQIPGYNSPSIAYKRPRPHSDTSTSSLPIHIFEDGRDVSSGLQNFGTGRVDEGATPPSDTSSTSGKELSRPSCPDQDAWMYTQPFAKPRLIRRRSHVSHTRDSVHKHWGNLPKLSIGNVNGSLDLPLESSDNHLCLPSDLGKLQAYIRNNYSEFEERRRRRESGIVSSDGVTDDERRAYEKIFLGDSEEEWVSEADMDGVDRSTEESRVQQC